MPLGGRECCVSREYQAAIEIRGRAIREAHISRALRPHRTNGFPILYGVLRIEWILSGWIGGTTSLLFFFFSFPKGPEGPDAIFALGELGWHDGRR